MFGDSVYSCELQDFVRTIPHFGKNIIVCCDPGADDVVMQAQVNALAENIIGVIPSAGNTALRYTMANALLMNEITERKDIKVYSGSDRPTQLTTQIETGVHVYGAEGLGNLKLPSPLISSEVQDGVDFAVDAIKNAKMPVTLISTGGLTDVHKILQRVAKESLGKIAAIAMMGGVLDLKQSNAPLHALEQGIPRWAEFNIIYDPSASQSVFKIAQKLKIPALLSTLDLTHTLTFKKKQVETLRKVNNYVAKVISDLMGEVPVPYLKRFGIEEPQQPAHDLNASMCIFHPSLYTYEKGYITVDGEESPSTRGKTSFNLDVDGNVFVLKVPEERRDLFFANYEDDLRVYNTPVNIVKGYLHDIRSHDDIQRHVILINEVIEVSKEIGELDLTGLLITEEIAMALVEIFKANSNLIDVRWSLPKNPSNEMIEAVNRIINQCEQNRLQKIEF